MQAYTPPAHRDEDMKFTPSGNGYCRHCDKFLGTMDTRNFHLGYFAANNQFVCLLILIETTKFRCPRCFTRNKFVPRRR
jgi:phage FluMu protein Com